MTTGDDITFYVYKDKGFQKISKKLIGKKIGKSVIKEIVLLKEIPDESPNKSSIIYFSDLEYLDEITTYSRKHKIASICNSYEGVKQGVSIAIMTYKKSPKIIYNPDASKAEDIKWKSAIKKVGFIVK